MRLIRSFARLATLALVVGAACSGAKGTAQAAITAADEALGAVPPDAAKVMPDELKSLTDAAATAKDQFAGGDYQAALASAKELPAKAEDLAAATPAKKAELTAALDTLSFAMSRNLEAIKSKLDQLAKTKRLPASLDPQKLAALRETYASATQEWIGIASELKSGDLASAIGKGTALKFKVSDAMTAVGLVGDDSAWHNLTLPPK